MSPLLQTAHQDESNPLDRDISIPHSRCGTRHGRLYKGIRRGLRHQRQALLPYLDDALTVNGHKLRLSRCGDLRCSHASDVVHCLHFDHFERHQYSGSSGVEPDLVQVVVFLISL